MGMYYYFCKQLRSLKHTYMSTWCDRASTATNLSRFFCTRHLMWRGKVKEVESCVSVMDTWSQILNWVGLFLHCRKFRSTTSLRNIRKPQCATIKYVFSHQLVIYLEDIYTYNYVLIYNIHGIFFHHAKCLDNEILISDQLGLGQARDAWEERPNSWLSLATEVHTLLRFSTRFLLIEIGCGRPQQTRISGKQRVGDKVNWRKIISGRRADCISLLFLFSYYLCNYNITSPMQL